MKHPRSGLFLILALISVMAIASQASAQTNLLVNPGFEANGGSYDGWFTFGSGPQLSTRSTDNIARTDSTAAKIFGEFTGCPDSPQFDVGGFGQAFTPVTGMIYELSGYSYESSIDSIPGTNTCETNRLIAKIVFFDSASGGSEISSNEVVIGDGNSILDQWNDFSVSAPCPAGALRVEALFLFLQPGCDTGSVFVDDVTLLELTPETPSGTNLLANPSFTSGLTGWSTFGNVIADSRTFAVRTITGSAKLYGPFAAPGDASGMFQVFPVTGETDWEFSVYSMTTCQESPINESNDNFGTAKMVYLDSGGTELGFDETVIIDSTSPLGKWEKHTVTGTAPAGTDSIKAFILFIQPSSSGGAFWVDDAWLSEDLTTGIEDGPSPAETRLYQNSPNPFNPTTRIDFYLSAGGKVDIKVFDVSGRSVATLFSGYKEAGRHTVVWDGRSAGGASAASGVYYYTLDAGGKLQTRKMVLLR